MIIRPFVDFAKKFFKDNNNVKLIILTDRTTVSAGMLSVMELKNSTKSNVIVGLPPSSGINFGGGQLGEYMPNSRIGFTFTTRYISRARFDTIEAELIGKAETTEEEFSKNMLIPDIEAYKTVEDYEKNTDSVLERALNGEFDKIKKWYKLFIYK